MKDILRYIVLGGLFIIPALTIVVTDSMFFPYITGKNFGFRIIVEVILGAWVVLALLDAQYRPKFSYILGAFGLFMAVMLGATLFAEHVPTAFWSNFERMEGYVGLLHVFGYFLVLGSMLTTKDLWNKYLMVSVGVAAFVSLRGLAQMGASDGGGIRVDSTLGNAAYMAVYMLFHIFFVAYLFLQTKNRLLHIAYVVLGLLFVFLLLQTGTRGTAIGLGTGLLSAVTYIALFGAKVPALRRYAVGSVLALVVLAGGFLAIRNTDYVQDNAALARIANINLEEDLAIRSIIWSMAVEGVKERPVTGWGMGNYNYVFNEQYDPRLYAQEQWFDRVHNLVLDWLVAGGVPGLVTYFLLLFSVIYYLFVRQYFYQATIFTVQESAILVGLLVAYVTHNLVVFDNIISYIFFAVLLGLIHSRVARPIPAVEGVKIAPAITMNVLAPMVLVMVVITVYVLNVPGLQASRGLIEALRTANTGQQATAANLDQTYQIFDRMLTNPSFARQEVTEQFVQLAISLSRTQGVPEEIRERYVTRADEEITNLIAWKPNDARLYVFQASFLRAINEPERAQEAFAMARSLSPNKQWIILQQGANELVLQNEEAARDFFAEAFALDESFNDAREYYVASLFLTGDSETANRLVAEAPETFAAVYAKSDFLLSALNTAGLYAEAAALLEARLANDGSSAQSWASLAFLYYQTDDSAAAIDALARGAAAVPSFASTAQCITSNIETGRDPSTPCETE